MIRRFRPLVSSALVILSAFAPAVSRAQYSTQVPLPSMQYPYPYSSYSSYPPYAMNNYPYGMPYSSYQYSYSPYPSVYVQGDLNYYRDQVNKLNAQIQTLQSSYGYPNGYYSSFYPAPPSSGSMPAYTAPSWGGGSFSYPAQTTYQPPRPAGPAVLDQDGGIFQGGGWFFYLTGRGFAPYESVAIREDGNQVRTVQADAGGNIRPGGIPLALGRHVFTAVGQSSGASAVATVYGAQNVTSP